MNMINPKWLLSCALMSSLLYAEGQAAPAALPPLPDQVPVTDLPDSVYLPSGVVSNWVATDNTVAMKRHAWDLFAAVMKPMYSDGNGDIRVFETWYSLDEAVPPIGAPLLGVATAKSPLVRSRVRLHMFEAAEQNARGFRGPIAGANRMPIALNETAVADVKYNVPIARYIEDSLTKTRIDPATGQTVVIGYTIKERVTPGEIGSLNLTDRRSVMLKPSFTIIKGKGPTIIGRWDEGPNVTNPASVKTYQKPVNASAVVASERTWTHEAIVYPSKTSTWAKPVYYNRAGVAVPPPANLAALPKFNLNDFHYVVLNQAQVDSLKNGILKEMMGPNIDNIEVGDIAVLTSMHISTLEIDTWTWQTFWWQPSGGEPLGENGASILLQLQMRASPFYHPLRHFRAGVGYSYTTAKGEGVICSNPYLEGSFGLPKDLLRVFGPNAKTDGVNVFLRNGAGVPLTYKGVSYVKADAFGLKTNCVTCHYAAAYPPDTLGALPSDTQGKHTDWGKPTGTEDLFFGRVRTHFLWSIANKVRDRESKAGQ